MKIKRGLAPSRVEGFTLMEILIYIAVLAMIFLAVSGFLTWTTKSGAKARAIREVADNARRAMEIMTNEIRGAAGLYGPTSAPGQLSLETRNYLPADETSTYIDFYLCGEATSTICFKKESQNPVAITSDRVRVSNLKFFQLSTTIPSIQISLNIDYKTSAQSAEYQASINATSTASLRNY